MAVLDFSYKFGNDPVNIPCFKYSGFPFSLAATAQNNSCILQVNVKLRLPAVFNKFLQPISVSAEEFFPQWRSLSGPPLKLQEVVRLLCFMKDILADLISN